MWNEIPDALVILGIVVGLTITVIVIVRVIRTRTSHTVPAAQATTSVRVFHNNHPREALMRGYQIDDTVTEVFAYAVERDDRITDRQLADQAFELFNVGDDPMFGRPDPRALDYRARGNRSLSVGDVVAIDGRFYACDSIGWRALPTSPIIRQRGAHGSTT